MTKKCHQPQIKLTFSILGKYFGFLKHFQQHPQVVYVFTLIFQIYQDVVNEDNDKSIYVTLKHPIHEVHKCPRGISETKGHY